jgi:uncharacterized SAM-dependent methyltransferase
MTKNNEPDTREDGQMPEKGMTGRNDEAPINGKSVNGHHANGAANNNISSGINLSIGKSDVGELMATAINIFQGREAGTALHLCYTDPKETGGEDSGAQNYDDWVLHPGNYNFHDEVAFIERRADSIVANLPKDTIFYEIGPGGVDNGYDSPVKRKTRVLVEAFERVHGHKPLGYHAIDTNERYASEACKYIEEETGVKGGYTVTDYRKKDLTIDAGVEGTPFLIVLGGTLMNLPSRQDTSPQDAFKRNIQYVYNLIAEQEGYFFVTHDETENREDIMNAYDPQDPAYKDLVNKLGKTFLHRIFNELSTDNFDPNDFEMEIGWNKVEGINAMRVIARAKVDKDFSVGGVPLSMRAGQEFDLAYSFKQKSFQVQKIIESVGFTDIHSDREPIHNRINTVKARATRPHK